MTTTSRLDDNLSAELEAYEAHSVHGISHTTVATKFATDAIPHHDYAQAIGQVYDLLTADLPDHLQRVMELYEAGEYQQAAAECSRLGNGATYLHDVALAASVALDQAKT